MNSVPPIATLAELDGPIADRDVVWCDVRWYLDGRDAKAAYAAGHLPGAVYVDMDTDLAAPPSPRHGRHPLPEPEAFATSLGNLGIDEDALVIAYDDNGGFQACRLVWMLRAIGCDAVVLDGGIQTWTGALEQATPARSVVVRSARPWPTDRLADIEQTASAALDAESVVIDARSAERFRGETEPIDPVAGHIPGAVNAPLAGNLVDGLFASPAALRTRFVALGIGHSDEVIAYCGSGVTACHNILAIERAGLGVAKLFPGSWSQWSSDPRRPVATGE
ncbi:MAG: sulfurtransferase [Actinobacteria bacterium]|nr:sulfurtransferase [Actinomycetota bacterium]